MKDNEVWPGIPAGPPPVPIALDPCGVGAPGVDYDNKYAAAQAVDPRRELLYRIDYKVGQLLQQISALHEARRVVEHASYEVFELLHKLDIGGL